MVDHEKLERESPFPVRKYKKVKVTESRKKKTEFKPLIPWFCDFIKPDTNKKCGRILHDWDSIYYNDYGACEDCVNKFNLEKLNEKE